jgi:hypothetical protein
MKDLSRLLLAPALAAMLLLARIEAAGLPTMGLGVWRSTRCAGNAVPCA